MIEPAFVSRGHGVLILILILLVIFFLILIFILILLYFRGSDLEPQESHSPTLFGEKTCLPCTGLTYH